VDQDRPFRCHGRQISVGHRQARNLSIISHDERFFTGGATR
jgi:hypothetical protein